MMMTPYKETLAAIHAARLKRDTSRSKLYGLLLQQLKLLRAQKKADRRETATNPDVVAEMVKLSEQTNTDMDQLRDIESRLANVDRLQQEVTDDQADLEKKTAELEMLQTQLAEIESSQQDANSQEKAKLDAQGEKLLQRLGEWHSKIRTLKQRLVDREESLQFLREQGPGLERERGRLQSEIEQLQGRVIHLSEDAQPYPDQSGPLDEIARRIAQQREILNEHEKGVVTLLNELFAERSPQQLISEWDDGLPILLLPLRLETRFKEIDAGLQLWVRVFPDEVAVTTHEKILTESEYQSGLVYWKTLRAAADDQTRQTAWQTLADLWGANRAAWVALQTKPLNWKIPPPASDDELQFPEMDLTKPDAWTQAPHSVVMPDRFVLLAYRADKLIHSVVGNQINDHLVLGPAPLEDTGQPSVSRDPTTNRLQYGEDFQWVTDFFNAVASGMAFRLPLDALDWESGFDQLIVVGLKLSADEDKAKKLIEDLIDNHHYSAKGFSFVLQGAATNNTDNNDSHFGREDFLHSASYFVETGDPLFTYESDLAKASDGQRLADYLGITYEPLQHVSNSNATDHAEGVAMNRALCAGTLHYYVQSILNEVIDPPNVERLRNFFTQDVTGRGPLAAIRVGNQPYGILLTSVLARWAYPSSRELDRLPFDEYVRRVVVYLLEQWRSLQPKLSYITKSGNAHQGLMDVLGLQPTSADYYQRIGYTYDHVRNLEEFTWGGKYGLDLLLLWFEELAGREFLDRFGYRPQREDGSLKPVPLLLQLIYQHYHTRLDNQNLIDDQPLSEERSIKPYDEALAKNYIHWLIENSNNVDKLEEQDFGAGIARPNALLYMMLHNALLLEAKNSINSLLTRNEIVANELLRSRKFMNISSQPDISPWEVFRAPANRVVPNETSDRPLLEFVQFDRFTHGDEAEVGQHLGEAKDALGILASLPTARLERLLAEHIDTLNYRLDSWQMALFDRRLQQQRGLGIEDQRRRPGLYLGSYGYLENVRRAEGRRVKISEQEALPPELREGTDNLYYSPDNGGYVHTPSINHAAAAAILRNGYLTHASPEEYDKLAVNLSSERVRRAMYLIDGVRNGQSLEALLGYLFERGLHDWTTRPVAPVILDQLKPIFRKGLPIKRTKLPRQGYPEDSAEIVEDFSVVNGLDLAQRTGPFPYGIPDLPALTGEQIAAIEQEKKNIENSLDALRDILTAECAYQLALGNIDRATAVMQAISGGDLPVEIQVINSARGTDLSFTQRVTIHFDPGLSTDPWPSIPLTQRASLEPGFNHWAGELLDDPATVYCKVQAVDAQDAVLHDAQGDPIESLVRLADLKIQPLDFVHLIRRQVEPSGYSELESRVRYHFARQFSLSDATIVKIEFANAGGGANSRSFAEVLPLANAIREVAGKARPLQAQDFKISSKNVSTPSTNPGNIQVSELQARVESIRTNFDTRFSTLETATTQADSLKTQATVEALRNALSDLANAGFVNVLPFSMVGFGDEERESLLARSRALLETYEALKKSYDEALAKVNTSATKPPQKVALLIEMTKSLLGADFVILPKFTFSDPADVLQAHTHRAELLNYVRTNLQVPLPVEEWLHGVSLVRSNMHQFHMLLLLSQTFNGQGPECTPMQLPYQANDTWLGMQFPEDTSIVHDTLSIVQCLPQGFQPAGLQCGLLIDEWVEPFPQKEEVTGIALNYDQPNSAPPSVILLAVTPVETGHWQWEDVVDTIRETFERARLRAVEPDMIETLGGFATLVPSTIAEFSTGQNTISLDYALNLAFVYANVAQLVASWRKE